MRLRRKPAAVLASGVVAAMALTACAGGDGSGEGSANVGGLEACVDDPNECNTAERQDGGELTWAMSSGWDAWNGNTAAGNSLYLTQATSVLRFRPETSCRTAPGSGAPTFLSRSRSSSKRTR